VTPGLLLVLTPGHPLALTPGLSLGLTPGLSFGLTPGLSFGPHPCNSLCLGREPKARVATTKVLWIAILSTKSLSFPKVVPSERTSIATGVAIVDDIGSTIQVGGHTPKVVLLDTSAQLVILGVQFAKKMGMFDSKLWKSMWQIPTTSGNVEEVFGESSDLIALNFNEGTHQELCL